MDERAVGLVEEVDYFHFPAHGKLQKTEVGDQRSEVSKEKSCNALFYAGVDPVASEQRR
jgi:hypothetical protein